MPQIQFTNNKVKIKKAKLLISQFTLEHTIINRNIDLGHLFLRLAEIADNMGLTTIRLRFDDGLFTFPGTNVETFKNKGNGILKDTSLSIVLTPKLIQISTDTDRLNIMEKYHDDLISVGHPEITCMIQK